MKMPILSKNVPFRIEKNTTKFWFLTKSIKILISAFAPTKIVKDTSKQMKSRSFVWPAEYSIVQNALIENMSGYVMTMGLTFFRKISTSGSAIDAYSWLRRDKAAIT